MASIDLNNEKELLIRIAQGDEAAFRALMQRYGNLAFSFIYQHCKSEDLAREILQDIFVQVWLARETLPAVRDLKSFLFIIARNYAIDAIRKLAVEKKHRERYGRQLESDTGSIENEQEYEQRVGLIDRAVAALPPQQQKVWLLSRRERMTYAAIAQNMGLSKETVKKYLQLANQSIINRIEEYMGMLLLLVFFKKM